MAPPSAATSWRGLGHAIGVSPGGGRRHGRTHGWLGFLRGVFGFQRCRLLFVFSETLERFSGRLVCSAPFYVGRGSTGRAVLRLCAVCSRATAANRRQLPDYSQNGQNPPARAFFAAPTLQNSIRVISKLFDTSRSVTQRRKPRSWRPAVFFFFTLA